MNSQEQQILSDLGKLTLFAWRWQRIGPNDEPSLDLKFEYELIRKQYDLEPIVNPPAQIKKLLNQIMMRLEKSDFKSLSRHVASEVTVNNGFITEVTCICGKSIKYRVPLKVLSDFHCPRERL